MKNKALVWELKGDKFVEAGKDKKAFEAYQKAQELNPERIEIYDKLINIHSKYADNWDDDDFAYNISLTMQKQELIDPLYKRVHARLENEYKQVLELIKKVLSAKTPKTETKYIEEIKAYGSQAIYPLIDYLLGFKEMGKKTAKNKIKSHDLKKEK